MICEIRCVRILDRSDRNQTVIVSAPPRSLDLPLAVVEGSLTTNFNKAGVRL